MREDDDELISLARIKRNADETTHRKIDNTLKVARSLWGLILITFLIAGWAAAIQMRQSQSEKDLKRFEELLNQVYERQFGIKITFR